MSSYCRAFGLDILSEIPVPGALESRDIRAAEVQIRRCPAEPGNVERRLGPYTLGALGVLFEKTDVARFLISMDGKEISVEQKTGSSLRDVSGYLIATALPVALWLRGHMVIHAATFLCPDAQGAIAVMGASGTGKSTLLRSLVAQGCAVVAEDVTCIRMQGTGAVVSGLPGCLWLRSSGAKLEVDREVVAVPKTQCREEAPLRAIVVLGGVHSPFGPHLERLTGIAPLQALIMHRHRSAVASLLGLDGPLLPRWAALANSVAMYRWNSAKLEPSKFFEAVKGLAL